MSANILVLGSANMDVVTPVNRLPLPGETIFCGDISLVSGGKGANAAVAAARLGGAVSFAGCVGNDVFGAELRASLMRAGVNTRKLETVDGSSGTAVILLNDKSGQNSILVGSAANSKVEAPDDSEWYAKGDMLMMQLEIPVETAVKAAQMAKEAGTPVLLDPAPASADLPAELLSSVDVLLPNETELATLTGMPVERLEQVAEAARAMCVRFGIRDIVVTMGARGAFWVSEETTLHVKEFPVDVVDTTAAGDTFAGALAVSLSEGNSMPEAIQFAVTAGSMACTTVGAQTSIPTREQVVEGMKLLLS